LQNFSEIQTYLPKIRAYVPIFVGFIDYITTGVGAVKNGNAAVGETTGGTLKLINKSLGVSLRYEVGRIFGSLERLRVASEIDDGIECCNAYGTLLLHVDRFYKAAGIYPFYNPVVSNEFYYKGVNIDQLVYECEKRGKGAAETGLKDLVVVVGGPLMGRTGTVVSVLSGTGNRIVKLDELGGVGGKIMGGVREIEVVKDADCRRRLGEQDPDAVFVGLNAKKGKKGAAGKKS